MTLVSLMVADCVSSSFMIENIKPMSEAVKWYDEFNNMRVQKIVFEADK